MAVVLLVEDELAVREAIRFHLEHAGFTVRATASAAQAWEVLPGCHAVVLDWMLPDQSGLLWLKRLREGGFASLPVLMLTARASEIEYRYHEALVHPAMARAKSHKSVLVLGGGDGLAVREVLRYPDVERVTLVDLDPAMTTLHQRFPPLAELTGRSLSDPRVRIINDDAFLWVGQPREPIDVVLIDFPDPNGYSLGKLYSTRFFNLLRERLGPDSVVAIQCTSPLVAPRSFWCINATMQAAGFHTIPYQATVPSFGVWGYVLASPSEIVSPEKLSAAVSSQLRFLTDSTLSGLFHFPADLRAVPVEINRLDSQVLVRYYEEEWRRWN